MTTISETTPGMSLEQHFNRIDTSDDVFVSEDVSRGLNRFVDLAWPSADAGEVLSFYQTLYLVVTTVALPGGEKTLDALTEPRALFLPVEGAVHRFEVTLGFEYIGSHSVLLNAFNWRNR